MEVVVDNDRLCRSIFMAGLSGSADFRGEDILAICLDSHRRRPSWVTCPCPATPVRPTNVRALRLVTRCVHIICCHFHVCCQFHVVLVSETVTKKVVRPQLATNVLDPVWKRTGVP